MTCNLATNQFSSLNHPPNHRSELPPSPLVRSTPLTTRTKYPQYTLKGVEYTCATGDLKYTYELTGFSKVRGFFSRRGRCLKDGVMNFAYKIKSMNFADKVESAGSWAIEQVRQMPPEEKAGYVFSLLRKLDGTLVTSPALELVGVVGGVSMHLASFARCVFEYNRFEVDPDPLAGC